MSKGYGYFTTLLSDQWNKAVCLCSQLSLSIDAHPGELTIYFKTKKELEQFLSNFYK